MQMSMLVSLVSYRTGSIVVYFDGWLSFLFTLSAVFVVVYFRVFVV